MRGIDRIALLVSTVAFGLTACASDPAATVETAQGGIRVLLNNRPLEEPAAVVRLRADEILLVDGEEPGNPPEAILARPMEVLVGESAEMYVLDVQDQLVKVFERSGRFLRSFGGLGDGPGQLRNAWRLAAWGDTIGVLEEQLALLTLFHRNGDFLDRIPLPGRGIRDAFRLMGGGYLLARAIVEGNPRSLHSISIVLEMLDDHGDPLPFPGTSGETPSREIERVQVSPRELFPRRFTNESILQRRSETEYIVAGADYTFWVLDLMGNARGFRRASEVYRYPPWWFEHWRKIYEERGNLQGMPQTRGVRLMAHSLAVDDEDHLWVIEFASLLEQFNSWSEYERSRLVVLDEFDSDGRWLRHLTVEFPMAVRLFSLEAATGGYFYGRLVAGAPTDKEFVVRFKLN